MFFCFLGVLSGCGGGLQGKLESFGLKIDSPLKVVGIREAQGLDRLGNPQQLAPRVTVTRELKISSEESDNLQIVYLEANTDGGQFDIEVRKYEIFEAKDIDELTQAELQDAPGFEESSLEEFNNDYKKDSDHEVIGFILAKDLASEKTITLFVQKYLSEPWVFVTDIAHGAQQLGYGIIVKSSKED